MESLGISNINNQCHINMAQGTLSKQISDKFSFIPSLVSDAYATYNAMFKNQPDGSVWIGHGQREADSPYEGNIQFIISYRRTSSYGIQVVFTGTSIYSRLGGADNWEAWRQATMTV